jgi:uncharacterized membrane protein
MLQADQSILVDAPRQRVFAFVADYRNAMKYERHFSRLDLVPGPTSGIGTTVDARGRFRGIPVRAKLRIEEFVEGQRIVSRSVSGLRSSLEWNFAEEGRQTRVRLVTRYSLPVPFVPRQVRESIHEEIQAMTRASLKELKRLLEVDQPAEVLETSAE